MRQRAVEIVPTTFPPELRARILEVMGPEGDVFARKLSQAQVDSGFVAWLLKRARTGKEPVRLAHHLLKTAWHDGWVDPAEAENAKREARRKRLEALR